MSLKDYQFRVGEQFMSCGELYEIVTKEQYVARQQRQGDATAVYMKSVTTGSWNYFHHEGNIISSGTLHKCWRHTDMSESK